MNSTIPTFTTNFDEIESQSTPEFLTKAIEFADRVWGTLSCTMLIDDRNSTVRSLISSMAQSEDLSVEFRFDRPNLQSIIYRSSKKVKIG